jgi:hypothetical protein
LAQPAASPRVATLPLGKPKLRYAPAGGRRSAHMPVSEPPCDTSKPVGLASCCQQRCQGAGGKRPRPRPVAAPRCRSQQHPNHIPPCSPAPAATLADGVNTLKPSLMASSLQQTPPPPRIRCAAVATAFPPMHQQFPGARQEPSFRFFLLAAALQPAVGSAQALHTAPARCQRHPCTMHAAGFPPAPRGGTLSLRPKQPPSPTPSKRMQQERR